MRLDKPEADVVAMECSKGDQDGKKGILKMAVIGDVNYASTTSVETNGDAFCNHFNIHLLESHFSPYIKLNNQQNLHSIPYF